MPSRFDTRQNAFSPAQTSLLWIGGTLLGVLVGLGALFADYTRTQNRFAETSATMAESLVRKLGAVDVVLVGMVGLYQASEEVSDLEFTTLASETLRPYPYLKSVLAANVIDARARPEYEKRMRDQGFVEFHITEPGPRRHMVRAALHSEHLAITHVEPLIPANARLLGHDLNAHPMLQQAAVAAVRDGGIIAAPPNAILPGQPGLHVFKARYLGRYQPSSEGKRTEMLSGVVAVEIDLQILLENIAPRSQGLHVALSFADNSDAEFSISNEDAQQQGAITDLLPLLHSQRSLPAYGQTWHLRSWRRMMPGDFPLATTLGLIIATLALYVASTLAWRNYRLRRIEESNAEQAIREEERRFKNMVENAFEAVITTDGDGRVVTWNRQAEELFGWRAEELVGQALPKRIFAHDRYLGGRTLQDEGIEDNQRIETEMRHRDRQRFPVEISLSIFRHGKHWEQSAFIRDISERKQQEERLQAAKEQAEAGSLAKSQFLANMSHEIRTPMNGVLGMTELLLNTELNEVQRRYAQTAFQSGRTLLDIINNVLDFSKIEAGKLSLSLEPFDLRDTVEDVLQMLAQNAHAKGLALIGDIDPLLDTRVIGDEPRLRQVLVNLVGNALKFTEQGQVVVRVNGRLEDKGQVSMDFFVEDTGIGIEAQQLKHIFDAFTQADGSTTRRFGGTGLGLAICRQLVNLMDGEIRAESRTGQGTTFHFSARLPRQDSTTPAPLSIPGDYRNARVLVLDHNQISRAVLLKRLSGWGLDGSDASSPRNMIDLLGEALRQGQPYALAIVDPSNTTSNALDLIREITQTPGLGTTPIILYSAYCAMDQGDWLEAGATACIHKPARDSELWDKLVQVLADRSQSQFSQPAIAPARDATDFHGGRVLLVEDNQVNQALGQDMLALFGCRVEIAEDGQVAVQCCEHKRYDLILMDCHMPRMNGFSATREIRRREGGDRHVPIIALTADVQKETRAECEQAGMDDYLSKPFSKDGMAAILERWLPRAATAPAAASAAVTPAKPAGGQNGAIDWQVLEQLAAFRQDAAGDFQRKLIDIYLRSTPPLVAAMEAAIRSGDVDTLREAAHSLKASSAGIGARRLSDVCLKLESLARERKLDRAGKLFAQLEREARHADQALKDRRERKRAG